MTVIELLSSAVLQVGVVVTLVIATLWIRRDRRLSNIAGPEGKIFVGLGLGLPQPASLREWAQRYGEIYKIKIGWYYWVVLSSPEAIKAVFDKQVRMK
jgi:hypothetical protein